MKLGESLVSTTTAAGTGPKKSYEPLPEGAYTVILDRYEVLNSAKSGSTYLKASFKVSDGDHTKRLIWNNFMLDHPSSTKAVEIGKEQLNKFLKAAGFNNGLADLEFDTDNLNVAIGKPVTARVKIEAGTNGYSDKNKISSFARA